MHSTCFGRFGASRVGSGADRQQSAKRLIASSSQADARWSPCAEARCRRLNHDGHHRYYSHGIDMGNTPAAHLRFGHQPVITAAGYSSPADQVQIGGCPPAGWQRDATFARHDLQSSTVSGQANLRVGSKSGFVAQTIAPASTVRTDGWPPERYVHDPQISAMRWRQVDSQIRLNRSFVTLSPILRDNS